MAGLATGFCVVSILAFIAVILLYFQRRLTKNVQAEYAGLVARTEGPVGANSMRLGLQASRNANPVIAELGAFPSFRSFGSELEPGNSRLPRPDLGNLTLSRQELSAERFSNREPGNLASSLRQEVVVS